MQNPLLCSLVAHDKKQSAYEDEEISIGDRILLKNVTTEALEESCATINVIKIWLKLLDQNYEVRCGMYKQSTKEIFKHIHTTMTKPLSKKRPETYDINWWWMVCGKITKELPLPRRPKLGKKYKRRRIEF